MKAKIKRLLKKSDFIFNTASLFYNYMFKYHSYFLKIQSKYVTWYKYGRKSDSEIDPLRIIHIDPSSVDMMAKKSFFDEKDHISEIKGGDWNQVIKPIVEYDLYSAMESVFKYNRDWNNTNFYTRIIGAIEDGEQKWGCSSKSEFDKRCERLEDLYSSIKNEGYKSQALMVSSKSYDPIQNKRNYRFAPELSEVVVVIDKSGEIYFYDGRHRFIISKIIGLDSIPVRVKARHIDWQHLRNRYVNDLPVDVNTHPDLDYL